MFIIFRVLVIKMGIKINFLEFKAALFTRKINEVFNNDVQVISSLARFVLGCHKSLIIFTLILLNFLK